MSASQIKIDLPKKSKKKHAFILKNLLIKRQLMHSYNVSFVKWCHIVNDKVNKKKKQHIIIIIINTNHAITSVNIVCSFLLSPLIQSLINCFPCYNIFNGWKLGKAIAKTKQKNNIYKR